MAGVTEERQAPEALAAAVTPRSERLTIRQVVALLPLVDGLCLAAGFWLACWLRFQSGWWPPSGTFSGRFYALLVGWTVLGWLGLFGLYRLYEPEILFGGTEEYERALHACLLGALLLAFYSLVSPGLERVLSPGWLLLGAPVATGLVLGARFAFRRGVYRLRRRGLLQRRALVVGLGDEAREIVRQLGHCPTAGYQVVGLVDDTAPAGSGVDGVRVLGGLSELRRLVQALGVSDLVVAPTALSREQLLELYQGFGSDPRVEIRLSTGLYELYTTHARVKEVAFVPLVCLGKMRITGAHATLKTVLDYAGAALLLLLLSPLLGALALWIKRDSPGPVLHRRRVLGAGGREFTAWKLRTMYVDGDRMLQARPDLVEELRTQGKLRDDPRVTRVGRVLRRLSLDELPQLVNVLRGEMSLVGPRMITPSELERFGRWRHNLLTVKPGLTGLWQVSGRSDVGYDERVRLDMNYIRNYTIWLDLHILMNTLTAVLRGRGAY